MRHDRVDSRFDDHYHFILGLEWQFHVTLEPNVARALTVAVETAQHSSSPYRRTSQFSLLNVNLCRLVRINPSCSVVTVMRGVVRSAPCAAVRLGGPGARREETLRSIQRAELLVRHFHVDSLDSASRYRTPPHPSKLPALTLLGHSVNAKQRAEEIKTRPKSAATAVRLHRCRYSLHVDS